MNLILLCLLAYLIGSFPTAFIFSRLIYKDDIRKSGSGNVGTINYLRKTGSKIQSVFVLLIDLGKGVLVAWIAQEIFPEWTRLFLYLSVLLGHNYPVWLKFKGGRGMATLGGLFLFLNPLVFLGWWVCFGFSYLIIKNLTYAGVLALILINLLIFWKLSLLFFLFSSSTSMLVLIKYIPRLSKEYD